MVLVLVSSHSRELFSSSDAGRPLLCVNKRDVRCEKISYSVLYTISENKVKLPLIVK